MGDERRDEDEPAATPEELRREIQESTQRGLALFSEALSKGDLGRAIYFLSLVRNDLVVREAVETILATGAKPSVALRQTEDIILWATLGPAFTLRDPNALPSARDRAANDVARVTQAIRGAAPEDEVAFRSVFLVGCVERAALSYQHGRWPTPHDAEAAVVDMVVADFELCCPELLPKLNREHILAAILAWGNCRGGNGNTKEVRKWEGINLIAADLGMAVSKPDKKIPRDRNKRLGGAEKPRGSMKGAPFRRRGV